MHAGGGLFGDALQVLHDLVEDAGLFLGDVLEQVLDDLHLVVVRGGIHPLVAVLHLIALVDEQGHVAAVVHDELRAFVAGEHDALPGTPPVFFQRLALPGEHRGAGGGDGGGSVVLGGEDVAGGPAHVSAEFLQGLDQHAGLDGHVQGAGDADASERLLRAILLTGGHEAGHFVLGDLEFFAAEVGEGDVFDFVVAHSGRMWVQVWGLKRFKSTYQDALICFRMPRESNGDFSANPVCQRMRAEFTPRQTGSLPSRVPPDLPGSSSPACETARLTCA